MIATTGVKVTSTYTRIIRGTSNRYFWRTKGNCVLPLYISSEWTLLYNIYKSDLWFLSLIPALQDRRMREAICEGSDENGVQSSVVLD